MSERYLLTGVQLAMLTIEKSRRRRSKLVDEIIDKQFVGQSDNNIVKDADEVSVWWNKK